MKVDQLSSLLASTHDLSYAFGEMGGAARRFALPALLSSDHSIGGDLAAAAVAFTIQLAIDAAGRDPAEMRRLEEALMAVLKRP